MLSWGAEGQAEGHLDSYIPSWTHAGFMQWSLQQKAFFWGSCSRTSHKNAQATAQTTAQRHKLRHLSVTLSVYATSLLCPLFITSLHALSTSCSLGWPKEEWCQVHHSLDWGMVSTHKDMSFPVDNQCNVAKTSASCSPWRQSVKHLRRSGSCSLSLLQNSQGSSSVTLVLIGLISILMSLSTFLSVDENKWACCPWGLRWGSS